MNHDIVKMRQNYDLDLKVYLAERSISAWHQHWGGNVYVSFSGGKDSTVLLDLVRRQYPDVPAVFADTGLEYPEIRDFVKTIDNVVWLKPKVPFNQVIEKYGYPVISKMQATAISRYRNTDSPKMKKLYLEGFPRGKTGSISKKWRFMIDAPFKISERCCDIMKKAPMKNYEKTTGRKPFIGTMAEESRARFINYAKNGCNAFETKRPTSAPLSAWRDTDIWQYIKENNLPYSKIYDMGEKRTGCMFCMFGCHMDKGENRFERMMKSHPKQWAYCMDTLGLRDVLGYMGIKVGGDRRCKNET